MPTTNPRLRLPSVFEARVEQMIAGFTKALPSSVSTLLIAGKWLTPAQILAQLQAILLMQTRVEAMFQTYRDDLATRNTEAPASRTFYANLSNTVRQLAGGSPQLLALYGLTPPKVRAKLSAQALTIAKAKSDATRALRGTMGKKQRQRLTLAGQPTLQVLGPNGKPIVAPSATPVSASPSPTSE